MKTFKGTKGEWKYQVNARRILFTNPNMDLWFKQSDNNFDNTKDEVLANANLIESAPELLDALKISNIWFEKILPVFTGTEYYTVIQAGIERNNKAINKALGQ